MRVGEIGGYLSLCVKKIWVGGTDIDLRIATDPTLINITVPALSYRLLKTTKYQSQTYQYH